jgi:nitroimidazol reductase NimA-like FMN-containing flavoprotein (pyridoxamine 5'-phosphate oxidase superfamily)
MVIREMSKEDCLRVLARARLARLACAYENQPYVVPVYLVYHEPSGGEACLYGFTTPGQKVEWMRANPLVCVEVDEVAAYDQWVSIIAFGRYEELPETPDRDEERLRALERPRRAGEAPRIGEAMAETRGADDERFRAWQVLKTHPVWGEPGCAAWAARAHRDSGEPFKSVFYRVRIDRVTGREATRDARNAISYAVPTPPTGRWGWLRKTLTRVFGGRSKGAGPVS